MPGARRCRRGPARRPLGASTAGLDAAGAALPVWAVTPQRDAQPAEVRHDALHDYLVALPGALN